MGTKVLVDPAQRHLQYLGRIGFEMNAIADRAGLSHSTVRSVFDGRFDTIHKSTSDAILRVPADEPIPDHRVPNCFVRSMLLEMRDAGLSMQWVYRTAGVRAKFHGGIGGRCTSWEIYVRIKRVYDAFLDSDLPNLAGVEVGSGSTS